MTTSKDISGETAPSHQCSKQVTGRGGVRTCQHKGAYFEEGKHWCGIHAPSMVAKKKARKEEKAAEETQKRAEKLASKQAPLDGEEQEAPAVAALKLPETVEEAARLMIVLAQEAQSALARCANMTSRGWPDNTPAENYKVILQAINTEAQTSSDDIARRVAKAKQVLDPIGYPQG